MNELAGSAHISFEGNLASTTLSSLAFASVDETSSLKRNTLWPKQDFVVVDLEAATIPKGILHIQIEKNGALELGLYDQFHPAAIYVGPGLSTDFFNKLATANIIVRNCEKRFA